MRIVVRLDLQINWLIKDLQAVDRKKTPWVVVAGHRPSYVSTSDFCPQCRQAFEITFTSFLSILFWRVTPTFTNAQLPSSKTSATLRNSTTQSCPGTLLMAGHYDDLDTLPSVLNPFSRAAFDCLTFHNCMHMTQEFVSSADGSFFGQCYPV